MGVPFGALCLLPCYGKSGGLASYLTQGVLRGKHSLLVAPHGSFLLGASSQPKELCNLLMCVTMGLMALLLQGLSFWKG